MKKRFYGLLIMIAAVLCLGGCGSRQVDVQTTLTWKADGSGSRQILLTIPSSDFSAVFGEGRQNVEKEISAACPKSLNWERAETDDGYTYTFTLPFSSQDEYRQKVETIIGEAAEISMEQPDSVFASGVRYQENFTSMDLLSWLLTTLEKNGYVEKGKAAGLFQESRVRIKIGGKEYEQKGGAVRLDSLVETPVERIDILTHYLQNKRCSRQVLFTFSNASMAKNGDAIRSYMERRTPEGAQARWSTKEDSQICTVSVEKVNASALNQFMGKLFDGSESFVNILPNRQEKDTVFDSTFDWSELLDVSAYSSDPDAGVAVGYYVQWEDGMSVSVSRQNAEKAYSLQESERYGGYQTVFEKEISSISLQTHAQATYVIDQIDASTVLKGKQSISRTVALHFQAVPDEEDQMIICNKLRKRAGDYAEITDSSQEDGFVITIRQEGNADWLNEGMRAIYDLPGQLSYRREGDLLSIWHTGTFSDLIDLTRFIENDPLQTKLNYRLEFPFGESIREDSISSAVNLKDGTQKLEKKVYTAQIQGAYFSLTLNTRILNGDGFRLFGFLFLLVFATFLLMIAFRALPGLLHRAKEEGGVQGLSLGPRAFLKNLSGRWKNRWNADSDGEDPDEDSEPDAEDGFGEESWSLLGRVTDGWKEKLQSLKKRKKKKQKQPEESPQEQDGPHEETAPYKEAAPVPFEEERFEDVTSSPGDWDVRDQVERITEVSLDPSREEGENPFDNPPKE